MTDLEPGYLGFCGAWRSSDEIVEKYKNTIRAYLDAKQRVNEEETAYYTAMLDVFEWFDHDLADYRIFCWEKEIQDLLDSEYVG